MQPISPSRHYLTAHSRTQAHKRECGCKVPVVARSPDRATGTDRRSPATPGDLRSQEWHGQETVPQRRLCPVGPTHKARRYDLMLRHAASLVVPLVLVAQPAAQSGGDRVEQAVDRALVFLRNIQETDGSWRVGNEKNPAITALAVMAFLSAGHVPGEGPYADVVERGVTWVLGQQQPNGLIATVGGHEMYHHGICTLMLAEVAGMMQGKREQEVKTKLEKAIEVILKAQRTTGLYAGGWRYRMASPDADMSITGWQLLALRAAKNLGCDVPAERIDLAVDY